MKRINAFRIISIREYSLAILHAMIIGTCWIFAARKAIKKKFVGLN